jgi:hypothetical protein
MDVFPGGSGGEGDMDTTGKSGNTSVFSLSCQCDSITVIFTVDNVKSVAP